MNNIKKIGFSALAGSLVMVSANAAEYAMSGGITATYTTQDSPQSATAADSGKGLGFAQDLGFTASGELDNGFTVKSFMSLDTNGTVSNTSSQLTIGMGSLGTIQLNNKAGSKANGIDDITPNAYNEVWDGLTTGDGLTVAKENNPSFFGSQTANGSLDYRMPAQSYQGATINASITYDPQAGVAGASKGGVAATNAGSGIAYTVEASTDMGISGGLGYEVSDSSQGGAAAASDLSSTTGYIKYAMGGMTVAYQEAYRNASNGSVAGEGADTESTMFGLAYTMGDITVSYGEATMQTSAVSDSAAREEITLESIQAAYVMGAMTVSAAMSSTDNAGGVLAAKYEENTLSVSFAF
jgi:outer membrane protein OmpU